MEKGIWQEIEQLYQQFQKLGISEAVDYEKYHLYSLITNSTAFKDSTPTEIDTQLLFDEGVTAKGKPLVYHLMNEDLKKAYELAKEEARHNTPITAAILQKLNAVLMHTTGSAYNVMGGSFDSSKGEYRLCGVTAETLREQYELSFNAHRNLVTIHPWVDGNGRTARLLMNYIQYCNNLFPAKVFKEDRGDYILSLQQSQDAETNQPFLEFMATQLKKSLSQEIETFNTSRKKGFSFMF